MATKIKVKICEYDEQSNSIVVKFCSDTSTKSIDECEPLAYQPTMFSTTDPDQVIKEIARAGIFTIVEEEKREAFSKDITTVEKYKNSVGKEFEYDIEALIIENQIIEQQLIDSEIDNILEEILIDDDDELDSTIEVDLDNN